MGQTIGSDYLDTDYLGASSPGFDTDRSKKSPPILREVQTSFEIKF